MIACFVSMFIVGTARANTPVYESQIQSVVQQMGPQFQQYGPQGPTQEMLDDTPEQYEMADQGIVVPVTKAANDCTSSLTSGCKYYDVLNNELSDNDCDCVPEFDGNGHEVDNCPTVKNTSQEDWDNNGVGDACDDYDGDNVADSLDNCVDIENTDQADTDMDNIGDACEDSDNDGWLDGEDNCPLSANTNQQDYDEDGVGDPCDNCSLVDNPAQVDTNNDGQGDACSSDDDGDMVKDDTDNCPVRYNPDQDDTDSDGYGDPCDNCMDTFNPDQADSNGDGIGDACEGEFVQSVTPNLMAGNVGGHCSLNAFASGSANGLIGIIMLFTALAPMIIRFRKG